ncbi:serine hydrolase domain-containing protein [Streptomyces sp. NPDC086082]|uniref:serine hydrolase domain-containing protein n=1 Tax=Streptomyces sp. NPDC086082 TaxID=3365750 RepID=UPI0037FFFB44
MPLPLRLVSLLVATCVGALVPASPAAADDHSLQRGLDALVAAPGGPPGVIVVLRDGDHQRVLSAGTADITTGRPLAPDDHTRTASTSKAFSGAVALSLVREHRLSLDDTIGTRLPRQPRAWRKVTLRQLLQHTSGLPDFSESTRFRDIIQADPHHHFDSRRLLDFVAGQPLRFTPGSQYRYSNSDNIAVALMAEAATGVRYEDLLRRNVYKPLGLRDTSLPQGYEMPEPYMHGYVVGDPAGPQDVSEAIGMSGVWASGGITSSPRDLAAFIGGYAAGALTSKAAVREQRHWIPGASEPAGPGHNSAGLALFRYDTKCGVVLGHTGNTLGYTQLIAATPDGRRALTFSLTTQVNQAGNPELLAKVRAVEEDAVCSLLGTYGAERHS